MQAWHAVFGVLLIFASGFLVGVAATRVYVIRKVESEMSSGPMGVRRMILDMMRREIGLTAEQWAPAEEVVREGQAKVFVLRQDFQPKIQAVLEEGIEQLRPILTEEQSQKLEAIYQGIKDSWQGGPGEPLQAP